MYCEMNTLTEINDLRVLKIHSINMCQKCSKKKKVFIVENKCNLSE